MDHLNEKERLLNMLDRQPVDRVPCACPLQTGTVELMAACGSYWPDANHDPKKMSVLAKAAHDLAGIESVRVPFDVTVDASAFGAATGYDAVDRQPAIIDTVMSEPEMVSDTPIPDPWKDGRAPVLLEAIHELSRLEDVPVICGIVAPFMLAAQLRGGQVTLMDLILRPDVVKEALEKAMEWDVAFAKAAIDAGADVITLIDATASGDILSPSQYEEFALPYQKFVLHEIDQAGGYGILHICGDTHQNMPLMLRSRAKGISVDQCMDIGWVKEQARGKAAVIGNVNPTSTLLFGRTEDVSNEAQECLRDGCDVLAPGCGFAPRTPLANMRAMVSVATRHWPI
ncbi:MAG: Methylcobamide:CoM methyltransferase MtbA [Methanomassiliicoccales archaeon PtaU1.Bin124]|nr:MAG: Methylcobamide:CoM methyltransferase MtbA [Methanomassiliicoccales archaeon PtaU1.Bin124]